MDPIALLVSLGVPQRFAKAVAFVILALAIVLLLWAAKCSYDRHVIANHNAQQNAVNANADRKADTNAADQRITDAGRLTNESQQTQEAINEARSSGADPRAAYYECVEKQQLARQKNLPAPDC